MWCHAKLVLEGYVAAMRNKVPWGPAVYVMTVSLLRVGGFYRCGGSRDLSVCSA